jgi:hypothetical protein
MLKRCYICKTEKPVECFSKNKGKHDGLNNRCRECDRAKNRKWYSENKDAHLMKAVEWRQNNRAKSAAYTAAYRKRHPEKLAASVEAGREHKKLYHKRWYALNLATKRAKNREWARLNPVAHLALCARRRAAVVNRAVPWANQEAIRAVYAEARKRTEETGIPHEVDHYYPLQGKTVSGLHVESNLRVVTADDNRSKHNFMPTT